MSISSQISKSLTSSGIWARYFFGARYFREFERFDRHLEKLRRSGQGVDYVSICSPNYLHWSDLSDWTLLDREWAMVLGVLSGQNPEFG